MKLGDETARVVRALQLRGRAGARDVACRAGLRNEEVIAALLDLEKRNKVDQSNGFWWLAVDLEEKTGRKRK